MAELSAIGFNQFAGNNVGNHLLALFAIVFYTDNIPLCPNIWTEEAHKVDFLRQSLIQESWAHCSLRYIIKLTAFLEISNEHEDFLQYSAIIRH